MAKSTKAQCITITTAAGANHTGWVQNCYSRYDALRLLRLDERRASKGLPFVVCAEPQPGHVTLHTIQPGHAPDGDTRHVMVDIRGASFAAAD